MIPATEMIRILSCLSIAVVIGLVNVERVQASSQTTLNLKPEDPLEISDIVVRGVVEKLMPGQFDLSSGTPGTTPSFLPSITARVRLLEVLRGSWSGPNMLIVALHDSDALAKGQEYIICGVWNKNRQTYVTAPHIGIYAKDGGGHWTRRLMPPGSDFQVEADTLTTDEVHARIERGSLRSVTGRSDLIVTGTIIAQQDSVYALDDGRPGRMRRYSLEVGEVLKGQVADGNVEFVVPRPAECMPAWTRYTPKADVGQRWLVFLQAGEWGLYPFAGRNSMLLIDGDELIYNSIVPYPRTRTETIGIIQSEVQREGH